MNPKRFNILSHDYQMEESSYGEWVRWEDVQMVVITMIHIAKGNYHDPEYIANKVLEDSNIEVRA